MLKPMHGSVLVRERINHDHIIIMDILQQPFKGRKKSISGLGQHSFGKKHSY